jgi:hypothetical protein
MLLFLVRRMRPRSRIVLGLVCAGVGLGLIAASMVLGWGVVNLIHGILLAVIGGVFVVSGVRGAQRGGPVGEADVRSGGAATQRAEGP